MTSEQSLGCLLYAICFHRSPFDLPDSDMGGSVGMGPFVGVIPDMSRLEVLHFWSCRLLLMPLDFLLFVGVFSLCVLLGLRAHCAALAVVSGKYEIPASCRYSKGVISLIGAMLQSRLEDRPFVGAIITRLEAMLVELGVPVGAAVVHSIVV
jgi:hypothetical protein